MSLQRDYIGVIPVALSLLTIPSRQNDGVHLSRFTIIGILFSFSALIKPQLGIGLPIVFVTLLVFRWRSRNASTIDFIRCVAVTAASFLLPVLIAVVWLTINSSFTDFIDIFSQYLLMHSSLNGRHTNLIGVAHVEYLIIKTLELGGYEVLFLCALFAYYRVLTQAHQSMVLTTSLICLFLLTVAYVIYPTIGGKFWDYHYMPVAYFLAISTALCLYAWPDRNTSSTFPYLQKLLPFLILLVAVTLQGILPNAVHYALSGLQSGPEAYAPKRGRVDEIAKWLKGRLQPGDTVQPLDWTGGSIHAMLLSEAKLATQFMYDYHFYHHVSSVYTQRLREKFIQQLRNAAPRFIIEVVTDKPWVSGVDTTREFPDLRKFLDERYEIAFKGNGYLIYEQKDDAHSKTAIQNASLNGAEEATTSVSAHKTVRMGPYTAPHETLTQ
jgi:hypothetical protein